MTAGKRFPAVMYGLNYFYRKVTMNKKILITGIGAVVVLAGIIAAVLLWPKDQPYDYDLSEYVKVGDYKGLDYSIAEVSVTDDEVDTEIDSRLQSAATTETVTEGKVEDGDSINIAFAGTIDGEEFEGGSSESYDITVGTTQMIDGFVEGLIGHEIGDNVILNLKFPDDYSNEDVAGKDVVFDVTINYKSVKVVPELDEDFVKENSDVDTVDEYKEAVKEELLAQKESQADLDAKEALWNEIVASSEVISYPEEELEAANAAADEIEKQYKSQAESYGMEWEDFLESYMGSSQEDFEESKKQYAEETVLQEMVMYYIAREEGIEVTDKEYKEYLADSLETYGFTEDTFKQSYGQTIEEYADDNQWRTAMLLEKVLDKVMEYGNKVEADDSAEE